MAQQADDHERIQAGRPATRSPRRLPECLELGPEEMYYERFDIPAPEALVFCRAGSPAAVFRSGCCYTRGRGKIFYFRPGHESYPTYFTRGARDRANAARWAAPVDGRHRYLARQTTRRLVAVCAGGLGWLRRPADFLFLPLELVAMLRSAEQHAIRTGTHSKKRYCSSAMIA